MRSFAVNLLFPVPLRFYARENRPRPVLVYNLAQGVLQRTGSRWIDPDKCVGEIPQNLIDELLNPRVPLQTILDNPEKAGVLKPIALPSSSWFYGYLRSFEAQPDEGLSVVTSRYGKETWEREHLVFDTFVTRAAFPLQYVCADHWLLDVFIVDEATRDQLNRLWLTALIDAFSRSLLGIALLYEAPGIHSIQSALQHAIWPKDSHTQLDLPGEWACYGIPQQLSLDNAWAHHSHSLENLARNKPRRPVQQRRPGLPPSLSEALWSADRAVFRQPVGAGEATVAGGDPVERTDVRHAA